MSVFAHKGLEMRDRKFFGLSREPRAVRIAHNHMVLSGITGKCFPKQLSPGLSGERRTLVSSAAGGTAARMCIDVYWTSGR
jgi:hypothetical protein